MSPDIPATPPSWPRPCSSCGVPVGDAWCASCAINAERDALRAEVERLREVERARNYTIQCLDEKLEAALQRAETDALDTVDSAYAAHVAIRERNEARAVGELWRTEHENALASWRVDVKNLSARIGELSARLALVEPVVEAAKALRRNRESGGRTWIDAVSDAVDALLAAEKEG